MISEILIIRRSLVLLTMRFKLFGVRIYISFWTVAILTLTVISTVDGQITILLCLLSAFIHELGHLLFICKIKGTPRQINVLPSEIQIISNSVDISFIDDICITVAGVLANFIFALCSYLVFVVFNAKVFLSFAISNIIIFIFNILPVENLDGGQLLRLFLSTKLSFDRVDNILKISSVIFMIPILFIGIIILFISKHNYSLLFLIIYFLVNIINKEIR